LRATAKSIDVATAFLAEDRMLDAQQLLDDIDESMIPTDLRITITDLRIALLERQHAETAAVAARHYRQSLLEQWKREQHGDSL
jgi:hypothetical protein